MRKRGIIMALINCTECGKEFSDKAPACPNCGCPVSEIVAAASTNISLNTNTIDIREEISPAKNVLNTISSIIPKSEYHATKKIGPIQIDEPNKHFRIDGKIVQAQKTGLIKGTAKGILAVSTMGLSLLATSGKHVGSKEWFEFADLVGYELLEDDSCVTSGGVGQALVGGAAFGVVGAIVGGTTAKRKTKKKVDSLIIKVTLNSFKNSCIMIPLITKSVRTDSSEYKKSFNEAHSILSALDVISHNS